MIGMVSRCRQAGAESPMIVDAERLPPGELPPFDLCIVGAGAAGITLALALIGSGLRICILESGGRA